MQGFHRFMASKGRQQNLCRSNGGTNQNNKEASHNEDEMYLMDDQDDMNEANHQKQQQNEQNVGQDDEADPLDAFMQELEQSSKKEQKSGHKNIVFETNKQKIKTMQKNNQSIQSQADQNSFSYQSEMAQEAEQNGIGEIFRFGHKSGSENEQRYDGQIFDNDNEDRKDIKADHGKRQKKVIQTLKPVDFTQLQLEDFQKDFYTQHPDIARLTEQQVNSLRKQFQIKVHGDDIPRPIVSFAHLELHQKLKQAITKQQFEKPTPIQAQTLPIALKGRDVIGVAKTGSGKTLAYLLPLITHASHQRQAGKNEGSVALILAPTRQLCQQIYVETKKYAKRLQLRIGCLLGGQNKHEQWKMLRAGVDILIASPGRLIQMIRKKATNTHRVTYLVLDEADKMLSLGFEHQIRSIVSQTRPDRQTLLFTATMKQQIQFLAYDILESPIRVTCGDQNAANENVKQDVVILDEQSEKQEWLISHMAQMLDEGKVLIFCNQKQKCEEVRQFIADFCQVQALTLYGDKTQYERTVAMNAFKTTAQVLIATDIASRGIDVKAIKTVLNYECPQTIESYIHRIGRAGRAEDTGTAISLLLKKASSIKFAIQLVKIFESSGYPVSKELEDLACMDDFYRRKRISSKMGVSFAKGKDASRFLNQILKQQQRGNSKAGIGMNLNTSGGKQYKAVINKNNHEDSDNEANETGKTIAEILQQKNLSTQELSISQISKLITEEKSKKDQHRLASKQLNRNFVKSTTNEWNI